MRIDEVRVQNFKSIQDSGWVSLEDDLTALVGENEAGKSNFLEALSYLGTDKEVPNKHLCKESIENIWEVDKSECTFLSTRILSTNNILKKKAIGKSVFHDAGEIVVKADSTHRSEFAPANPSSTDNEPKFDSMANKKLKDLNQRIESHINHLKGIRMKRRKSRFINKQLNNIFREYSIEKYISLLSKSKQFNDLKSKQKNIRKRKDMYVELTDFEVWLLPSPPIYDHIGLISDSSQKDVEATDPPYKRLATTLQKSEEKESAHRRRRSDQLKRTAEELERGFNDYWSQANITFEVNTREEEIEIEIYEDISGETTVTLPEDRSEGFRWFLSFYLQLMSLDGSGGVDDDLILLDDPGTYLHPRGQKDLRQALSELAKDAQIVYSTHSPYMLDPDETREIRLVQRNDEVDEDDDRNPGTVVHTDLSQSDAPGYDTLAPVRAALGAEYADSLFASTANLLVEGYTDETYLKRLSKVLTDAADDEDDTEGDEPSDEPTGLPEECSVLQMSGGDNTTALVRLLEAEGYDYYVLLDSDRGGELNRDKLDDIGTPDHQIGHVADFLPEDVDKAEIEDLLGDELLVELFTASHDAVSDEAFADAFDGSGKFSRRACGAVNEVQGQNGGDADFGSNDLAKEAMAQDLDRRFAHGEWTLDDLPTETRESFRELFADVRAAVE